MLPPKVTTPSTLTQERYKIVVNTSRYLGSDEILADQDKAIGKVYDAASQANARMAEGMQNLAAGQIRNSQQSVALTQQLAQASQQYQESGMQQLAKGIFTAADQLVQANAGRQAEAAAKAANERKVDVDRRRALADTELSDLISKYESDNWGAGEQQFQADAQEVLGRYYTDEQLTPDHTPNLALLMAKASDARLAHSKRTGESLRDKLTVQTRALTDRKKAELQLELTPQFQAIKHNSLDTDVSDRVNYVVKKLNDFRATSGLPPEQATRVTAEILSELTEVYGENLGLHARYTAQIADYSVYSKARNILEAKRGANQITHENYVQAVGELDTRYPGFSDKVAKLGDANEFNLKLAQTAESQRQLILARQKEGISALRLPEEAQRALIARAIIDPRLLEEFKNNENYKDNPDFKLIVSIAEQRKKYDTAIAGTEVDLAEAYTKISRVQLTNAREYVDLANAAIKAQSSGKTLTPAQVATQALIDRTQQENPQLAAVLAALQNEGGEKQVDYAALQKNLDSLKPSFAAIQTQVLNEVKQKQRAIAVEYADLIRLRMNVSEADLQKMGQNAPALLADFDAKVNEERQRQSQLAVPQQYGQQPGFSQSSSFAPVTDDKGKLLLVPRANAHSVSFNGAKVTIPTMGSRAAVKTSDFGMRHNKFHAGVDFAAPVGTKAISLISGTVMYTGAMGGYGNMVDVLGDNGILYRFAHHKSDVTPGQRVFPGQAIATSDNSGRSTGPHLHFEVRQPQFNKDGTYNVNLNLGRDNAIEPMEHLARLSAGSSIVLQPRGDLKAFRASPGSKAPNNSTLLSNGVAVNGGTAQSVWGRPMNSDQMFSAARPASTGAAKGRVTVGSVSYDVNDDMGYAELQKDAELRKAFHATAQRLGVPATWIVDIARQESGGINPQKDHNGNHYGLFGFGDDSFSDKSIHRNLRAGKLNGAQQVALYERYILENGWERVVKKKGGVITIADLWAFSRMGTKMRNQLWDTGDLSVPSFPGTKLTFADELKLLGKWVGRRYDMGDGSGRSARNQGLSSTILPDCKMCQQLALSDSFVQHRHT